MAISWIGCNVIRREGDQLHQALRTYEDTLDKLHIEHEKLAKDKPNRPVGQLVPWRGKFGIRDYFQITLLAAIILFVAFDMISALMLLHTF